MADVWCSLGCLLAARTGSRRHGWRSVIEVTKADKAESIDQELVYRPKDRSFSTRRNKPLYLWNLERQRRHKENASAISEFCNRLLAGGSRAGKVPCLRYWREIGQRTRVVRRKMRQGMLPVPHAQEPADRRVHAWASGLERTAVGGSQVPGEPRPLLEPAHRCYNRQQIDLGEPWDRGKRRRVLASLRV